MQVQSFNVIKWALALFVGLCFGGHAMAEDRILILPIGTPGQTWANSGEYILGAAAFTGSGGFDTLTFNMPGAPDGNYLVSIGALGQFLNFSTGSLAGTPLSVLNVGSYGFVQGQQTFYLSGGQFTASFDGPPSNSGLYTVYAHAEFISAVPEPETYAMLLAGIAAVGFVASRRERQRS